MGFDLFGNVPVLLWLQEVLMSPFPSELHYTAICKRVHRQ